MSFTMYLVLQTLTITSQLYHLIINMSFTMYLVLQTLTIPQLTLII